VDERSLEFVEVGRLVYEVVEFIVGSRILYVMQNCLQNVHAESFRSQFLIECWVNDSLKDGDQGSELVRDLGDRFVDAEM
jgi:hypothetical protein